MLQCILKSADVFNFFSHHSYIHTQYSYTRCLFIYGSFNAMPLMNNLQMNLSSHSRNFFIIILIFSAFFFKFSCQSVNFREYGLLRFFHRLPSYICDSLVRDNEEITIKCNNLCSVLCFMRIFFKFNFYLTISTPLENVNDEFLDFILAKKNNKIENFL